MHEWKITKYYSPDMCVYTSVYCKEPNLLTDLMSGPNSCVHDITLSRHHLHVNGSLNLYMKYPSLGTII